MLTTGDVLHGQYRIERQLGRGGMGSVYLGTHLELDEAVAIKEMEVPPGSEAARIQQFKVEAKMVRHLEHRGLPKVYDFFGGDNRYYIVMEFIQGCSLEDLRQLPGSLAEERVLNWARDVGEVLHYLHSQQPPVIFRDLKPSNIMVSSEGRVKLIDFGISKFFDQDVNGRTQTGAKGMGSPGFAPPEQFGSGRTDERTDIYAFGATLYSLLTGTVPPTSGDIASGIVPLPPLLTVRPDISSGTALAIERMMDVKRTHRPQSMLEALEALGIGSSQIISPAQPGPTAPPPSSAGSGNAKGPTTETVTRNSGPLGAGSILLGRYQIVRPLSAGGFGAVYEAVDTRLDNVQCAVKEMHKAHADKEDVIKKFNEEMRFLARLRHDGIPRVIDYFAGDSWYIVMDFIDGQNLEQELESNLERLDDPAYHRRVVDDILQVLDVLTYIHGQEPPLIHRDIKPANLIRDKKTRRVKVVDFGLARPTDTLTRSAVGTLAYSAIEQLQGHPEPRSDIYSVGASIFHLLAGRPPVPLYPEPLESVNASVDADLAGIVATAMASNATSRYRNTREMREVLENWLKAGHAPAASRGPALAVAAVPAPASSASASFWAANARVAPPSAGPSTVGAAPASGRSGPSVATVPTEITQALDRTSSEDTRPLQPAPSRPGIPVAAWLALLVVIAVSVFGLQELAAQKKLLEARTAAVTPAPVRESPTAAVPLALVTKAPESPLPRPSKSVRPAAHPAATHTAHASHTPTGVASTAATPMPEVTVNHTTAPPPISTSAAPSATPYVSKGGRIVPGRSVGEATVGMDYKRLPGLLHGQFNVDQGSSSINFMDEGVTAYVFNNAVTTLQIGGPAGRNWKTDQGIGIGSSRDSVIRAFGKASGEGRLAYPEAGILFTFDRDTVSEITVQAVQAPAAVNTPAPTRTVAQQPPPAGSDDPRFPYGPPPRPPFVPSELPWPPPAPWMPGDPMPSGYPPGPGQPPPPRFPGP